MRRALAVLLMATSGIVGWAAVGADAATVTQAGWWDRNANDLLPALDPPPDGALRVANDPTGASAIAAVRFQVDAAEGSPMLVLRVAGDPAPQTAGLVACPATSEWTTAAGAPMAEAPTYGCVAGAALGRVSGDGTTVSFDLGQLVKASVVDVVISPAPTGESPLTDTFTVDVDAPEASDITTGSGAGAPVGVPSVPAVVAPSTGPSGSASFTPPPVGGGLSLPASPTVSLPAVQPPAAAVTATPPSTIDGEEVAAPLLDPAASTGKRWVGLLTAAAILGLGIYLWRTDRARAVMSAGPVLGGLGPFVRERTAPAPQVV